MRLGGDDSDYLTMSEFDHDDPDYLRFDYTGGFTLSVYGASTGSKGYHPSPFGTHRPSVSGISSVIRCLSLLFSCMCSAVSASCKETHRYI